MGFSIRDWNFVRSREYVCPLREVLLYLCLLLSSDLSWTHHIESTCTKARKLLGLLYQQFSNSTDPQVMAKLYLSLVRPHLEYDDN